MDFSGKRIALAITGGIAAYRSVDLVRALYRLGAAEVTCLMTDCAQRFITPLTLQSLSRRPVLTHQLSVNTDGVPDHIALAQTHDALVIHPATANVIAQLAHGLADDIVATTALCFTGKPLIIAPAMNTRMWQNPLTLDNIAKLKQLNQVRVIPPSSGLLACGEIGDGHLADQPTVLQAIYQALHPHQGSYTGKTILVTAGGSQEAIDPVRVISNRSSGRMGIALADEAYAMGAQVILLAAKTVSEDLTQKPYDVHGFTDVESLQHQLQYHFPKVDVLWMAAAVSDFTLKTASQKIKRQAVQGLELFPTSDLLLQLSAKKQAHQRLIGFAAESEQIVAYAQEKLIRKGLDAIVVNDISRNDIGFESQDNEVTLLQKDGTARRLTKAPKWFIARALLQIMATTPQSIAVKTGERSTVLTPSETTNEIQTPHLKGSPLVATLPR